MISTIIPTSNHIPSSLINSIIKQLRKQTIPTEIIVSNHGIRKNDTNLECDCLTQYAAKGARFSLSKVRNEGAKRSRSKWLAFTDCDIYYIYDTFENILMHSERAIRGYCIQNTNHIGEKPIGEPYKCGAAPMLIERELFEKLGGYCEKFKGWGYEDSDFEHKLKDSGVVIGLFPSFGYHILSIHKAIRSTNWHQSSEDNRVLFEKRTNQPIERRIKEDRIQYG